MTASEDLIGSTPLIHLHRLSAMTGHRVLGKCEFLNPNGSVKDRIALAMIDAAEAVGRIRRGVSTIVEATGGNTGIALATVAVTRGYRMLTTLTSKMSTEKVALLRALGAEVEICPYEASPDSPEQFINRARIIAAQRPDHYFVDQFANPANPAAHFRTTAPEIWRQAGAPPDAIVAGAGTGGTLMGLAQYARQQGSRTRIVLADPHGSVLADAVRGAPLRPLPYRVEGIGGDFVPPLLDISMLDAAVTVPDDDTDAACRWMLANEGLFVGGSSGCAVAAAMKFCAGLDDLPRTIVVMLADSGRNYLGKTTAARREAGCQRRDLETRADLA